jgi:hypothetical protein
MNTSSPQIEPCFADAIAMIEHADELPVEKKRHWCCSLKRIAEALDKPATVIPARLSAVRTALMDLHHVPLGLQDRRVATVEIEVVHQANQSHFHLLEALTKMMRPWTSQDRIVYYPAFRDSLKATADVGAKFDLTRTLQNQKVLLGEIEAGRLRQYDRVEHRLLRDSRH